MEDILSKLRAKNISIDVLNNQIKLKIPEGLECEALLDEVNNNSADLISFIERLKNVNSSLLEQDHIAKQKSFWISAYQDLPEALDLPLDYMRNKQTDDQYESHSFEVDEQTTSSIRRLGEINGATIFTVLLSAYTILLSRLSNREDVVVGVSVTGRRHAGPEGITGAFINMLALRNYPSGQLVFRDFLTEVNSRTVSFFDHQDFQYEDLIDELKLPRDTGRNPLFEAAFSYENFETDFSSIPELDLSFYKQRAGISKIDLSLFASTHSGSLYLNLVYPTALFSESSISRFGAYFQRIISAIIIDNDIRIADIDILSDREKDQFLNQDNSRVSYPEERTVVNYFEEQVLLHPDRIALVDQGAELSYRVLDSLSNRLARALRAEGVGRESIVGLLTGRTQETVIGMLGILKAGGAYLPMDLDYPQDRIHYMLEDSKALLLLVTVTGHNEVYPVKALTVQELINRDSISDEAIEPVNSAQDLCYVIYTSGTTGYPKGVLVEHRNVVRLFFHDSPLFDFGASDVWTMFHNPYFDFSVWEIYGALLFGGKLIIIPKMIARDSGAYLDLLVSHGVTILNQTPSAFYNLDEAESLSGLSSGALKLRYIIFGGEALKPLKLASWYKKYPDIKLVNMFGITETTVHVTYKLIGEQEILENVSNIGVPIPTLSTYIFDRYQRLVPQGVSGELYVGGAGVSRGYLNRDELTKARFIQNPYNLEERLYRTGDLCRQQVNGELEYIGRIDHQVKIRGYRIELGEIESRLLEHKKVSDALVIVKEDDIDKYLVGYYVAEKAISVSIIREYLQNLLPDYMLPSYYVHLSAFPLTANGKVDRRALPEVVLATEDEYEAPSSKMEHILVGIWSEILKIDRDKISVSKSFFDLGGHSLKAMILINRIWKKTGTEVSLKTIFSHQDIRSLSACILEMAFGPVYTAIPLAVEKAHYVLSSAQKRLYFLYEFDRDSLAYNMPRAAWLSGEMDRERLVDAFQALIGRHEVLRSTIVMIGDEPFQVIGDGSGFSITDYQARQEEVAGVMESFIRPFDLGQGPLLRVGLVHVPGGDSLLMVDMHHIIADEASQEILIRDFMALYAGEDLPAPGLQYKEYAEWQQSTAEQDRMAKQKSFWLSEYQDLPETLDLPLDYTRPKQAGNQNKSYSFELDKQTTASLRYLGEQHSATLYAVLLSVYTILLGRLSRSEDVVVGTPIAGRRHADLDGMIGMFVNTLALRNYPLGKLVFQDFIAEVNSRTLSCFDHQDFQYEDLVDELNLPRNLGRSPLIEFMFSYENFEREELVIPDLMLNPYQQQKMSSKFDLTLAAIEDSGKLDLSFAYSAELFKETTISRFATYFKHIVGQVLAAPDIRLSEIGLLVPAERSRLLELGTGAIPAYSANQTIVQLFEAQVLQSPDAVALVFEDQVLSYQELDEQSDQLSLFLAGRGVARGTVIGLLLERSPDMIIGILGILKAGGIYVPIDSILPQERILYMLTDSGSGFLLTSSAYSGIYQDHIPVLDIAEAKTGDSLKGTLVSEAEDLLYIIYTSGSSGKPKGVIVNNVSLVNYIQSQLNLFKIDNTDRILQFSTISFDASVEQIWLALLSGAGLVLVKKEVITDQALLNSYLHNHQVTHLHATPSFLESISLSEPNSLRRIIAAGEVCRAELANRYLEKYDFYNKYGPT
ncbi:amino acid adenylation domain-containing protein, partial [Pedobacter cryoconitis]